MCENLNAKDDSDGMSLVAQYSHFGQTVSRKPRWRLMLSLFVTLCLVGIICLHESESRISLRVALCVGGILSRRATHPTQLIAHRGCEWPLPENTLPALLLGANALRFVEIDIALSKDGELVAMHDETLDRTTNGTGIVCERTLAELRQLHIKLPTTDPSGLNPNSSPTSCEDSVSPDSGYPGCHFRIPTLELVFKALPHGTRYMIDVKVCYIEDVKTPSVVSVSCNDCKRMVNRVHALMLKYAIPETQVVFTSTDSHSLQAFGDVFRSSGLALSVDHHFVHYSTKQFLNVLDRGDYDAVAMYYGTAGLRPDLVRAARESKSARTRKHREVYAWTIRKESNARIALCSGADNFIVADPELWKSHMLLRTDVHTCSGPLSAQQDFS